MSGNPYRIDTNCGFEIWVIPTDDGIKFRAFFESKEVGMDWVSGKLSKDGAKQLGAKLIEIAAL